jgi:hypothetical protein
MYQFSALVRIYGNDMATVERICPREPIYYNCSFHAHSEPMELTWEVAFPSELPTVIHYDGDSSVGDIRTFGSGIRASLTKHRENSYIESVLILELDSNTGPVVGCIANDLVLPTELNIPVFQGSYNE